MDDAVRLVCPECELVYRVRNIKPGKAYKCKKCGGPLRGIGAGHPVPGDGELGNAIPLHNDPYTNHAGARAADFESGIAKENVAAMSSTRRIRGGGKSASPDSDMLARFEGEILRLSGLIDALSVPAESQADGEKRRAEAEAFFGQFEAAMSELNRRLDGSGPDVLADRVKDAGDNLLSRLEEQRAAMQALGDEFAGWAKGISAETGQTLEIDIQDLADRLVEGIKLQATQDGPGSAAESLAKTAEELVQEQKVNTARLEALSNETREVAASIAKLEEWRGDLPILVADEIGRTVEDRVVGPISDTLERQAPAILAGLQDNKLVDIVSRAVREAQRPLLREILAGGRGGVPLWLFASILLPLLLILGYLFLPGEFGLGDGTPSAAVEAVSENLSRLESSGVPLAADAEERLRNVEEVVLDIHGQAMTHARNAAALEEEVKSLKATLAERDGLIKDYSETLQKQVKRLRAYEMTLTRLGVSPESVEE